MRIFGYPHIRLNICGYFQSKFTMRIGKIYAHIQLIFEYDIRIGKIYAHCTYLVYSNISAYPTESALIKTEWTTLFFTYRTYICRLYIAKENGQKSSMPHIGIVDDAFSVKLICAHPKLPLKGHNIKF